MGLKPKSGLGPGIVLTGNFVLHVNKAYSTASKMGLLSAYEVSKKAYDSKNEQKAVLTALANLVIKAMDKEIKTAESLLLKAEEQPQETKEHHCPSSFSTVCQPSHQRSMSALGHYHKGADRVVSIH